MIRLPVGRRSRFVALAVAGLLGGAAVAALAQIDFGSVRITSEKLAPNVWMLRGAGGNLGLCAGPEGALLVDDQFAPLTPRIVAAVKEASGQSVRWVVNTHWHGDHVGGNENLAGAGATVIAQDRVRERLLEGQENRMFNRKVAPAAGKALPVITFSDSATLHVNGERVVVFHVPRAHTDGDAIVWFTRAGVVHMGDTFFNGAYPIIDVESGGSSAGVIAAVEAVLARLEPGTKLIPGHGPLGDRAALERYRDMLRGAREAVAKLVKEGRTLEQVQAAKPTAPWDEAWGKGFVKPELFVRMLHTDLAR